MPSLHGSFHISMTMSPYVVFSGNSINKCLCEWNTLDYNTDCIKYRFKVPCVFSVIENFSAIEQRSNYKKVPMWLMMQRCSVYRHGTQRVLAFLLRTYKIGLFYLLQIIQLIVEHQTWSLSQHAPEEGQSQQSVDERLYIYVVGSLQSIVRSPIVCFTVH